MKFLKRNLFTIIGIIGAAVVLDVEKIGGFFLFAPPDRQYIDLIIAALVVSEGFLLDFTFRRIEKDALMQAVLRSVNETLAKEHRELEESLEQIRLLSGLLPICSSCKRIRDDRGNWHRIEDYISTHSEAKFTHGICPECKDKIYPAQP